MSKIVLVGMGKAEKKEKQAAAAAAAPKGYVPMLVGREEGAAERLLVQAEVVNHPAIVGLLEMAAQEFGYRQGGVLRVPCDVDRFRRVLTAASRSTKRSILL